MENSIEFFLNAHIEWSLSRQDLVITNNYHEALFNALLSAINIS